MRVLGEALDLDTLRGIVVSERRRRARSTWRTWPWSRTASRTCAGARASTASRRRAWASASSAAPTRWRWPTAVSAGIDGRSARPCREGMELRHQLRLHHASSRSRCTRSSSSWCWRCSSPRWSAGCSSARCPARSTWCWRSRCRCSGTVAVIYFLGFTLNTFTLLALSLAVGIVVDDAIMVHGEHLPPRRERQGPRARGARGHPGDHLRRAGRDAGGGRDLHPGRLHEGDRRQVLPPVRRHALRRGAALVPRGDHAGAGALRAAAQDRRARAAAGSAASSTAASSGWRAATRWAAGPRPARPLLVLLGAGACCWSSLAIVRSQSCRASSCRRRTRAACCVRLQTAVGSTLERDRSAVPAGRGVPERAARGGAAMFAVIGGFGGGEREHRHARSSRSCRPTSAS